MERIRSGDEVIVISGRDKGRRGSVTRRVDVDHLLVEGVNRAKRHTKPNPQKNQPGGIVEKNIPIHISRVALLNPVSQKADRVLLKKMDDGTRRRVYKSNGELIDKA